MKKVILLTGHIGSGKTELASIFSNILIKKDFTVMKTHFSYLLKKLVAEYYDINKFDYVTKKYLDDEESFKQSHFNLFSKLINMAGMTEGDLHNLLLLFSYKTPYNWYLQNNGRRILQWLGTEVVRKHVDKNFWAKMTYERCKNNFDNFDFAIIDDLRFVNELDQFRDSDLFKDKVKLIKVISDPELCAKRRNLPVKQYLESLRYEKEVDILSELEPKVIVYHNDKNDLRELYKYWLKNIDSVIED